MSLNFFTAFSSEELQTAINNKLFRSMLDSMPIAVAVLAPLREKQDEIIGFTHLFANKAAKKMAHIPSITANQNEENILFNKMVAVVESGKQDSFIYNQNSNWVEYFINKYDEGILLVYQDIVNHEGIENKMKEVQFTLKEKNRELRSLNNELKTFTSIAAYDYKDTLQTLYTNLEYIISRDAKNLSNTGKANLRKAQTAIQKMKLLTDDIVAFSRIQTMDSNPSPVNLNEILANVIQEFSEKIKETGAEIESENLPVIHGYPFLLTLLFYHLIDNAIKFRNPEVKLHIHIQYAVMHKPGGDLHRIVFTDNGIGFPLEEADKIFQMFHRLHEKNYKGRGIGLAICRKITELHGGTIASESEPGKGTSVCSFFPIQ